MTVAVLTDTARRRRLAAAAIRHRPDARIVSYAWTTQSVVALVSSGYARLVIAAHATPDLTAAVTTVGGEVYVLRPDPLRRQPGGELPGIVAQLLATGQISAEAAAAILGQSQPPGRHVQRRPGRRRGC